MIGRRMVTLCLYQKLPGGQNDWQKNGNTLPIPVMARGADGLAEEWQHSAYTRNGQRGRLIGRRMASLCLYQEEAICELL